MNTPLDRRNFLSRSGLGLAMLGLTDLEAAERSHSSVRAQSEAGHPLFLNGGPSHVDTFDPKPELARYAGKPVPNHRITERKTGAAFPSPFKFQRYGQSGIEVSELFAKTAAHIDDIAVIRSMQAQVPNHEPSLMLMNCGDSIQPRPSLGAWLTYGLGSGNQNLPGFIAMCPGGLPIKGAENWQSAFLPGGVPGNLCGFQARVRAIELIENIRSPHADHWVQVRQLELLRRLNAAHRRERTRSIGGAHAKLRTGVSHANPRRRTPSTSQGNLKPSARCMGMESTAARP